jgi:hypothetical protein
MSSFRRIRLAVLELWHSDRLTDMTKQIFSFLFCKFSLRIPQRVVRVPQRLATVAHTQIEASTSMRTGTVCLHEKPKSQKSMQKNRT